MIYIKFLIIMIAVLINEICLKETKPLKLCIKKFIIVVDGGSSGTRLHYFGFKQINTFLKLNVTDKMSSNIALSKFSKAREDWSLMRIMFNNLTSFAISKIPAQCLNNTPIYVQVTAGVRQLDQAMSKKILNHIRNIFLKSRFKFKPEFVDILSSEKEGRLAWVSVNYLLGKFETRKCSNTIGMLDLGGGSTQVCFATKDASLMPETKKIVIFGKQYHLYTAGYDYMGINEIRLKFFGASDCVGSKCGNTPKLSYCMNNNVRTLFQVGNRSAVIAGKLDKSNERIKVCNLQAFEMMRPIKRIRQGFYEMDFVAISAFYYIIKSAFDIHKDTELDLMTFTISEIYYIAEQICAHPKADTKNFKHFQCMDLAYINVLLQKAYEFELDDRITISNKINKISLSWALGYAISTL